MNEQGKSFFSYFSFYIFLLALAFSSLPYAEYFTEEHLTSLLLSDNMPDNYIIFLSFVGFLSFLWLIGFVGSGLLTLLVHLSERFIFLFKLRKPMIIYKG